MKNSKNISLFKITLFLLINIFIQNKILLILSLLILLIENYKSLILFILILLTFIVCNSKKDFINIGFVKSINNNECIVEKFLYEVKLDGFDNLNIGDVLVFNNQGDINTKEYEIKKNILFTYSGAYKNVCSIVTRKHINNRIESLDHDTKAYIKKFILNEYKEDLNIDYLGYGFCFYYLLRILLKKDRRLCILTLLIYILIFGFEIKFYLIIFDIFLTLFKFNRIDKLSIKVIIICFINYKLLLNNSIILTLLFNLMFTSNKSNYSIISITQSLLFGEIQIITVVFFKYIVYIRIFIFFISLPTLFIPYLSSVYLVVINLIVDILKIINISIRGKINIIFLIGILIINRKIKNEYLRLIIICLLILCPLNNPLLHINFINVGQGDSSLIKGAFNTYNILIDTGSIYNYSKLKKELFKEGVYDIDYLIVTHSDNDHSGNIDNLKEDFNIKEIIYEGKDIDLKNIKLTHLNLGKFDNVNDNSLVYLLDIDDYKVLYTADISSKVEKSIINKHNVNDIDILKVSHHGSKSASSKYFIGSLKPEYAIISTSGAYNHPSYEVLNNLDAYKVKTYVTKDTGSICFYFTKLFDLISTDNNEFVIIMGWYTLYMAMNLT